MSLLTGLWMGIANKVILILNENKTMINDNEKDYIFNGEDEYG